MYVWTIKICMDDKYMHVWTINNSIIKNNKFFGWSIWMGDGKKDYCV